jgi:biotin operon repressor
VEEDAMSRARDQGASTNDIGRALGMTRQGVAYRLKNLREQSGAEVGRPEIIRIPQLEESEAGDST